jgi:hypothetical protein
MKPFDFTTWLKGYFDLSQAKTLTREQAQRVRTEVQQVDHSGNGGLHSTFCLWLEGMFDGKDDPADLTQRNVEQIQERLSKVCGTNQTSPAPTGGPTRPPRVERMC